MVIAFGTVLLSCPYRGWDMSNSVLAAIPLNLRLPIIFERLHISCIMFPMSKRGYSTWNGLGILSTGTEIYIFLQVSAILHIWLPVPTNNLRDSTIGFLDPENMGVVVEIVTTRDISVVRSDPPPFSASCMWNYLRAPRVNAPKCCTVWGMKWNDAHNQGLPRAILTRSAP